MRILTTYLGSVRIEPDPRNTDERRAQWTPNLNRVPLGILTGYGIDTSAALDHLAGELRSIADSINALAVKIRRGK